MKAHRWIVAGLCLADTAVLIVLCPHPAELARDLAHPRAWLAAVGTNAAVVTVASLALWLCAVWFGLGLVAVAARRLPGAFGRIAAHVCAAVLPAVVHRLLVGSAGLGVLLAPLPAGASPAPIAPPTPGATASATTPAPPVLPAPIWPSAAPATLPPPGWPSAPTAAPSAARSESGHGAARRSGNDTTVRAGDSLWLIAARRLGRQPSDAAVAASWPRWYAANRAVIGADPDLITPGQVLRAPPREHHETQQSQEARS